MYVYHICIQCLQKTREDWNYNCELPLQVLRTDPGYSARVASTLNHWAVSPALNFLTVAAWGRVCWFIMDEGQGYHLAYFNVKMIWPMSAVLSDGCYFPVSQYILLLKKKIFLTLLNCHVLWVVLICLYIPWGWYRLLTSGLPSHHSDKTDRAGTLEFLLQGFKTCLIWEFRKPWYAASRAKCKWQNAKIVDRGETTQALTALVPTF